MVSLSGLAFEVELMFFMDLKEIVTDGRVTL